MPDMLVCDLVRDLATGRAGRAELSRWMSEHGPRFLESDSDDSRIVAEIGSAWGDVQRGRQPDAFLREIGKELLSHIM